MEGAGRRRERRRKKLLAKLRNDKRLSQAGGFGDVARQILGGEGQLEGQIPGGPVVWVYVHTAEIYPL
jgi:hypothetical protein